MINGEDICAYMRHVLSYSEGPSIVLPRKLVEAAAEEMEKSHRAAEWAASRYVDGMREAAKE